ncbi:MAG: dehypoxanthine futalosine cyclase [Nitrospirae bacterium]|nr:dehypoxanthine futalosine cyclase [Nitrospirota bacterium]
MNSVSGTESTLAAAVERAREGLRLSPADGLFLLREGDFLLLGELAARARRRLHPDPLVTFVVDRNVNYTNICVTECRFCAFSRRPSDPDAYLLPWGEIAKKIEGLLSVGGTQILLQGGHNPALRIDDFENLFRRIKSSYPVHLHALSPSEVSYIARISRLDVRTTLSRLKAAGLDSIPGGGAEILSDRVRAVIAPKKVTADEWIGVMREAHLLGIPSSATMMFGSVETEEDILEHLTRIRTLQDETRGFTAFIPWSYQPVPGELERDEATAIDYLRIVAFSRLYLDNVPNIQASWVTQGPKIGQVALFFGVNDMGGTMMEENVVSAAGTAHRITIEEMVDLIREAGFEPCQRDTRYKIIRRFRTRG